MTATVYCSCVTVLLAQRGDYIGLHTAVEWLYVDRERSLKCASCKPTLVRVSKRDRQIQNFTLRASVDEAAGAAEE